MPYACKKIDGKVRLVNTATGAIAKTKDGTPRDGGGHDDMGDCQAQKSAIARKEKLKPQNNPSSAKRYRNPR